MKCQPLENQQLNRFLDMTSYLQKFLHALSSVTSDLQKLEETNVSWNWTEKHDKKYFKKLRK